MFSIQKNTAYLYATIAFSSIMFLTLVVVYSFHQNREKRLEESFQVEAERAKNFFYESLKDHERIFMSLNSFFAASGFVDKAEFHIFSDHYLKESKNLEYLFFCPSLLVKDIDNVMHDWQEQNPGFTITPSPQSRKSNEVVVPILYENNLQDTEELHGYDIASLDTYREALGHGITTENFLTLAATAPFHIGNGEGKYITFFPVKSLPQEGKPPQQSGYIASLVDINRIVADISGMKDLLVTISTSDFPPSKHASRFHRHITVNVLGKDWNLYLNGKPNFDDELPLGEISTFVIGWIFSLIVFFWTLNFVRQREETEIYSAKLEDDLGIAQKARQKADLSSAAKGEFLANMSHELRTPLNSIIGMAQFINYEKLDEETRGMFDSIKTSSKFLLEIINDILDISKIEAGELRLESIPFDVQDKITEVVHSLKPLASEKGLLISCKIVDEPIFIKGDPLRTGRIFINLIGNAIKYTPKGSITVDVEFKPVSENVINMSARITDTGIGISKENIEKVFEKFTQADSSITRKFGGTGLGLAITKQLVEKMGGKIGVESVEGQGSTFWVNIPFNTPSPDEVFMGEKEEISHSDIQSFGRIPLSQCRILIAEDHVMNQLFMKTLLKSYNVTNYKIVENGADAVHEAQNYNYDIILMDCHMPVMNGYDATIAIRNLSDPYQSAIPIVAMTANAMPEDEQKCLSIGMDGYISKPVNLDVFKKVLSLWIDFDAKPETPNVEIIKEEKMPSEQEKKIPLDLTNLKSNSMGDEEFLKEMIALFVSQCEEQISELKTFVVDGDSHEWVETSHALKGSAATVGAEDMRLTCAEAQKTNPSTIDIRQGLVNKIESQYEEVKAYLLAEKLYVA